MFNQINNIINEIVSNVNSRNRDVLRRRYGLGRYREPSTLQDIGDHYNLTRERVRQIEQFCLNKLRKIMARKQKLVLPLTNEIKQAFFNRAETIPEKQLKEKLNQYRSKYELLFILELVEDFLYLREDKIFYALWTINQSKLKQARQKIENLINRLKKERNLLLKQEAEKRIPFHYIHACKLLDINPFGELGLRCWPEIRPKGAREKAYLILRKQARPMHYREIARLIEELGFAGHIPAEETVHNELIKDERFILKGDGVYCLCKKYS